MDTLLPALARSVGVISPCGGYRGNPIPINPKQNRWRFRFRQGRPAGAFYPTWQTSAALLRGILGDALGFGFGIVDQPQGLRARHADDIISGVNVVNVSGHAGRKIRQQIER